MAASSGGHPPPPGPPGQQPSGPGQPKPPQGPSRQQAGPHGQSFAAAAGKNTQQATKYIFLHLHREDRNISFNLSTKEKAALVFRRLKLEPSQVVRIETCKFEVIRIEVKSSVDVERFKTTVAMQIRPGLKVKPMKELKKSTRIKVCWIQSDVPNEEISKVLSMYGKVVEEPEDLYFELTADEEKDAELVNMKSIKNGERAVEIEIMRNIPSYVKIAGQRARIWYKGQNYTCSRCYKSFRNCPGKADRKECLRLKGVERDFDDFWAEQMNQKIRKERLNEDDKFDTDTVDLSRVPDAVEKEELMHWLSDSERQITVDDNSLCFSGFRGTWRLSGIKSEEVMRIVVERLHGAKIRGKPILCLPIKQNTPAKPPPVREEPMENGDLDLAQTSDGVETQEERNVRIRKEQEETARAVEREKERLAADQAAALVQKKDGGQAAALNPRSEPGSTGDAVHEEGREERDAREDPERTSVVVGLRPEVAALESSAYNAKVSDINNPVNTNSITDMIKTGLTSFGILKKKGEVKVGSVIPPTSAPPDPKPTSNSNSEDGTRKDKKTTSTILVTETPAAATALSRQKQFVNETPATSPDLKARKDDITLGSDDEIFGNRLKPFSPSDLEPLNFSSEFARRVSFSGRDSAPITLGNAANRAKRKSVFLSTSSSDASAAKPSPEKEKPEQEEQEKESDEKEDSTIKKTPEKKADEDGFEAPLTKGQKKAKRKRQRTAAAKHNKF